MTNENKANIISMFDQNGKEIYPKTTTEAVGMADGSGNLDVKIKEQDAKLSELENNNMINAIFTRESKVSRLPKNCIKGIYYTKIPDGFKGKVFLNVFKNNPNDEFPQVINIANEAGEIISSFGVYGGIDYKDSFQEFTIEESGGSGFEFKIICNLAQGIENYYDYNLGKDLEIILRKYDPKLLENNLGNRPDVAIGQEVVTKNFKDVREKLEEKTTWIQPGFSINEEVNYLGEIKVSTDAKRTDYLPIVEGMKIVAYDGASDYPSYKACVFYDKYKKFISCYNTTQAGIQNIEIKNSDIPKNAYYVVSCTLNSLLSSSSVFIPPFSYKDYFNFQKEILPLRGKKIICFGDSITEFSGYGKRYSEYISELTGATVINVGIGGTQIRQRTTPTLIPSSSTEAWAGLDMVTLFQSIYTNDFTIPENAAKWIKDNEGDDNTEAINTLKSINWEEISAITCFSGTNDWRNGNNLGTTGSVDVSSTLGAINVILKNISTIHPKVSVYWFTPIVRFIYPDRFSSEKKYNIGNIFSYDDSQGLKLYKFIQTHNPGLWDVSEVEEVTEVEARTDEFWSDNYRSPYEKKTIPEYCEAIILECKKNHIICGDLYWKLGWNQYNFSNYFDDNDGVHPYKGFKELGYKIGSYILANRTTL